MKILYISSHWQAGQQDGYADALKAKGHDVRGITTPEPHDICRKYFLPKKILGVESLKSRIGKKQREIFNGHIVRVVRDMEPEVVLIINESLVYPSTLQKIRKTFPECRLANIVADNPFNRWQFETYPGNLRYFDHIFVGDKDWIPQIRFLAESSEIAHISNGVDMKVFRPLTGISQEHLAFHSEVSYVGSSYSSRNKIAPDGMCRAGLCAEVSDLDFKLWGDAGWREFFRYYPELERVYQSYAPSLAETNIINQASRVSLALSNPQVTSAVPMRVFEIIASGGFPVVNHQSDLCEIFPGDIIPQFKSREQIKDIVKYFLDHPAECEQRKQIAFKIVSKRFTYEKIVDDILNHIRG